MNSPLCSVVFFCSFFPFFYSTTQNRTKEKRKKERKKKERKKERAQQKEREIEDNAESKEKEALNDCPSEEGWSFLIHEQRSRGSRFSGIPRLEVALFGVGFVGGMEVGECRCGAGPEAACACGGQEGRICGHTEYVQCGTIIIDIATARCGGQG